MTCAGHRAGDLVITRGEGAVLGSGAGVAGGQGLDPSLHGTRVTTISLCVPVELAVLLKSWLR